MAANQIDSIGESETSIREECEELIASDDSHPASVGYLASKGRRAGEWLASRPWGQMIFKYLDRVLWCVERTMLWQNPRTDSPVSMGRPVNVAVAYPLAALLWVLQHLMFVGAETSSANELIKWVQTRRRRLRAVRFQGIRNMKSNNVLGRPETSRFAQVFWFLGMLPATKMADEVEMTKIDYEEDVVSTEDANSEQKKKRRFSDVSETTEGAVLLDDEYDSEEDSDYVPDHTHTSESDSDLSSVDEEEEENGDNLDESVAEKKVKSPEDSVTEEAEKPLDKSVAEKKSETSGVQ